MTIRSRAAARLSRSALACGLIVGFGLAPSDPSTAQEGYQRISGEGSSWAGIAIDAMRVNVRQFGITVDYNPSGSTSGRKNFVRGIIDFAASDIPFQFQPEDGSEPDRAVPGTYAYIPVTAGGTAFMYNLKINGQRVTNLRLSGENVAKIFTGAITQWNDAALQADNPGIVLPGRAIVPVVRSDGSGSTAQFTKWLIDRHPATWNDYCNRSGRAPACGSTSFYPTVRGMIGQEGDLGVAGYVSQSFAEGAIGYVNYSYSIAQQFPVVKVLNSAGFYTEPTPSNVAVSLLQARINQNESDPTVYLTQQLEGVYSDQDPRNYQLSSYSYFILPTKLIGNLNEAKGRTLGAFAYYAMCQAQQQSASLGYSPLPINLVQASFEQIAKVPGTDVQNINIQSCKNPTFSQTGENLLAANAPQPKQCDRRGLFQCPDGTGGLRNVPTATANPQATTAGSAAQPSTGSTGQPSTGSTGQASTGAGAGAQTSTGAGAQPTAGSTGPAAGGQSSTGSTGQPSTGSTGQPSTGSGGQAGTVGQASGGGTSTGSNSGAGGTGSTASGGASSGTGGSTGAFDIVVDSSGALGGGGGDPSAAGDGGASTRGVDIVVPLDALGGAPRQGDATDEVIGVIPDDGEAVAVPADEGVTGVADASAVPTEYDPDCDPAVEACAPPPSADVGDTASDSPAPVQTVVLGREPAGLGLIALVIALVTGLVLIPAFAWQHLGRDRIGA